MERKHDLKRGDAVIVTVGNRGWHRGIYLGPSLNGDRIGVTQTSFDVGNKERRPDGFLSVYYAKRIDIAVESEVTRRRAKEIEALLADRDITIAQAVEQKLVGAEEAEAWKRWDEETRRDS